VKFSLELFRFNLSIVLSGWNSPTELRVSTPKTYKESLRTTDEASHLDSLRVGSCYHKLALTWNLSTALDVYLDDSWPPIANT